MQTGLQFSKGFRMSFRPQQQFTIKHGAFRECLGGAHQFGELSRDGFFASGPQFDTVAPHQLHSNAIPFPFGSPFFSITQLMCFAIKRGGLEEAVGPQGVFFP